MHDEILMRVVHGFADALHQTQTGLERQMCVGAIAIQRDPVDVLHHEVRQPMLVGAAVEQTRDAGMIEPRQRPALLLEARQDLLGVEAAPQQLDRDTLFEHVDARRQVDDPHAAAADLALEHVRTEAPAGRRHLIVERRQRAQDRAMDHRRTRGVGGEQALHLLAQPVVGAAGVADERVASFRRQRHRLAEDRLQPGESSVGHRGACPSGSRGRDLVEEPGPPEPPVALDGGDRDAERLGGLFEGHAAEAPALDDLRDPGVLCLEAIEHGIEQQHAHAARVRNVEIVDGHERVGRHSLRRPFRPQPVDQNRAHCPRGHGEEVGAADEAQFLGTGQTQVELVHERRRLQRGLRRAAAEPPSGHLMQVGVDLRDERAERIAVAGAQFLEDHRHGRWHGRFGHRARPVRRRRRAFILLWKFGSRIAARPGLAYPERRFPLMTMIRLVGRRWS